jgi:hypothetical protein
VAFEAFYQTMAQLCFTLLGLWWLVLQTKYGEWIGVRERRRMITNISLYFLLPGAMSLMALLSSELRLLWQVAFLVASLFGAIETASLIREMGRQPLRAISLVLRWAGLALFVLVALAAGVALVPGVGTQLGIQPLAVTGILLTLVVVLGTVLAWAYFIQPPEKDLPTLR